MMSIPVPFYRNYFVHNVLLLITLFMFAGQTFAWDVPAEEIEGLQKIEVYGFDLAYIKPEADFSQYDTVSIAQPTVEFREDWKQDHRMYSKHPVTERDIRRIKNDATAALYEELTEQLRKNANYTVVDEGQADLLIKPAIVNLDIHAPDTMAPGRKDSYVTSAGSARLVLEIYDASGNKLGYLTSRREAHFHKEPIRASQITNRYEMRIVYAGWAKNFSDWLSSKSGDS